MSTEIASPPAMATEDTNGKAAHRCEATAHGFAVVSLAPPLVAVIAMLVHKLVPNQQTFLRTHLYPGLLQILLGLGLLLVLLQWAWRPSRARIRYYSPLFAGVIAWLCIWDLITLKLAWMPLPYFPGPDMVLQGMWDDWPMLLDSIYRSLKLLLTGYFIGVACGLCFGVLIGWFRGARYWGLPIMKVIGPIPATALTPLALLMFAEAFNSGAAMIAFAVCFPVTMLTMSGIANVPVSYFDVARTLGARRLYLIFRVAIPAALPSIFIGLFMGLAVSFLTLIVAETLGVKNGLGWYLVWKKGYAEYDKVYGVLVIMAVFFSSIMTLLFKVRDWVLGWQKGMIRW
ncbi:MAG TPA: ABC transporter permease [Gemmataceae bacterium]|nr:ABC transporter permease [Gemmataceae bacterium]